MTSSSRTRRPSRPQRSGSARPMRISRKRCTSRQRPAPKPAAARSARTTWPMPIVGGVKPNSSFAGDAQGWWFSLLAAKLLVARSFPEHVLGDDELHDLARALVDLGDLRVAVVP